MRVFIIFIAIFLYANIDIKIKHTKITLKNTKSKISNMNNKLDKIVTQINKENEYILKIDKKIEQLNTKIKQLEKSLKNNKTSITSLEQNKTRLILQKQNLENEVINFISNNYYVNTSSSSSVEDVINEEILKVITKETSKKMDKIYKTYTNLSSQIDTINTKINEIINAKNILQAKQDQMQKLKQQRELNLKKLQKIKLAYKKELQKIIASQNRLQKQLAKLNIIKTKELQKQRQRQKDYQQQSKLSQTIDKTKIKNYGNIYMKTKTARYKGPKTIAPLKGKIVKKFGAYKDPIYHILLYNDSITIKPFRKNAKVRAIMSGKVVFVGDTSEGKIVVIQHNHKLHSIYAKLSRISPFIKKGYKVKKGEVIAKVDNELEFEITYKTLPINPINVVKF